MIFRRPRNEVGNEIFETRALKRILGPGVSLGIHYTTQCQTDWDLKIAMQKEVGMRFFYRKRNNSGINGSKEIDSKTIMFHMLISTRHLIIFDEKRFGRQQTNSNHFLSTLTSIEIKINFVLLFFKLNSHKMAIVINSFNNINQ